MQNLLESLWHHFDDEKAALLAQVSAQEDHFGKEQARQLATAKLKRDQRQLVKEEMFEGCAVLLALAQQQDKVREAKYGGL